MNGNGLALCTAVRGLKYLVQQKLRIRKQLRRSFQCLVSVIFFYLVHVSTMKGYPQACSEGTEKR
jgi:hypothetical protein